MRLKGETWGGVKSRETDTASDLTYRMIETTFKSGSCFTALPLQRPE